MLFWFFYSFFPFFLYKSFNNYSIFFDIIGDILYEEKNFKEALECYNIALQIDPTELVYGKKKGLFLYYIDIYCFLGKALEALYFPGDIK